MGGIEDLICNLIGVSLAVISSNDLTGTPLPRTHISLKNAC